MDKRLTAQIQAVQTTMSEMDKRLTNEIDELDNRLTSRIDTLFWAIGALIGIILTVIALPQLLGFFQEKRARAEFEKKMEANFQGQIEALKQRLERQQQEIEELKS